MPAPVEIVLHVSVLFLFVVTSIAAVGSFIARTFLHNLEPHLRVITSYGLGSITLAAIVAVGKFFLISNNVLGAILLLFVSTAIIHFGLTRNYREYLRAENFAPLVILLPYVVTVQALTAFPDGDLRRIDSVLTRELLSLPIDNMIPYNMSRLILEDLDPRLLDIVPSWKAGDRGPLAGLVHSAFSLMFGSEETRNWFETSSHNFFVFQTVVSILNGFSLIAVWMIAFSILGKRSALVAVTLLCGNYFYLMNIVFSWPKFFMAYFALTALWLWQKQAPMFLTGIFFGAAMLAHDSALFVFAAFLCFLGFSMLRSMFQSSQPWKTNVKAFLLQGTKTVLPLFSGFLLLMIPWWICKSLHMHPSGRLVQMHFFCDFSVAATSPPFLVVLKQYLQQHPWHEIVGVRLSNAFYPLDPRPMLSIFAKHWRDPIAFLNNSQIPVFFQLIWGIGILPLAILFCGYCKKDSRSALRKITPILAIGFCSVFFLAAISGCPTNTVNHQWVYVFMLTASLGTSIAAAHFGTWIYAILALHLGFNGLMTVAYIHYHSAPRPFLHGTDNYFIAQIIGLFLLLGALILFSRSNHLPETSPT